MRFIIAKMALLILHISHMLRSYTYRVRSRINAMPSPQQQYWSLKLQRKDLMQLSNKSEIILLHIQPQQRYVVIVCTNMA